jgi:hypothetical protein
VKKLKGHVGREAIVAQVDKKNSFSRRQTQKNTQIIKGQPPPVRWSKAMVTLFWFGRRRNMKFSTTSPVHRVVRYFKTNTDATPVEFVYCCAMRSGAVIPLASARGITFNNCMDHRRTNFCKLKAKEHLSNHRRFSLHQFKHTSLIPYR